MQEQNNLPETRQKIAAAILENANDLKTLTSHRFNLVSANLFHFLPQMDFDQHRTVFTDIMLHNQLTHYEQTQVEVLNSITVENGTRELFQLMKNKACIFSSFHFGMYRLMNLFLTKNNIPYTVVIPQQSLQKEGPIFRDIYKRMHPSAPENPINFIEMESPSLSLKMIRELKQGRSLFIYFDGYRGAGNLQENRRYNEDGQISFLGQPLLARVGVAYLAQMAGVPLITGISYRKSLDDLRLCFFDPLFPNPSVTKEQFAHDTTQTLYDKFSPFLTASPGQWEAWLYLHRSLPQPLQPANLSSTDKPAARTGQLKNFRINHDIFGVFTIQDKAYLFNKETYTSYPIDNHLFGLLKNAVYESIFPDEFNNPVISYLVENKVIIPCAA